MMPPNKPANVLICLSGGADSTTALYESVADIGNERTSAILFDYKSRHNSSELVFAKAHCLRLGVKFKTVELPPLGGLTGKNWIVPLRNGILVLVAANYAVEIGANMVVLGCNKDDAEYPFPDCSRRFVKDANRLIKSSGYGEIEVVAPYINKAKWEIIGIAREHGVPLHELWTCYQPKNGAQCGVCPACKKLKSAIDHK